ncbi:hypothetical protein OROMI_015907 [Orobanche minor]
MLAFEVNHYLHQKSNRRSGFASLKLDMAKAYDRVEWNFLKQMMLKLGFPEAWVSLIMQCVCKAQYNIVSGCHIMGPLVPQRGLRQGDPISPYLFIICAEALSLSLTNLEDRGSIHGCSVAPNAPSISHLFFADDSYLFFKASKSEATAIKNCLIAYEKASGQKINFAKSSISFSKKCRDVNRIDSSAILGVSTQALPDTYLGLPSIIGRNRSKVFNFIEGMVQSRLMNWKSRFLSRAGKEIMLKSVVQALPTYAMSLFLIPDNLCSSLEKMMNSFWWGSDGSRKSGIHWKAWDRLCIPKKFGGMGFRKLHYFNIALLAKQGWRLLTNPNSLVARVYKACYYPDSSFLDAALGDKPNYIWRSILSAQHLVSTGARRLVGSGKDITIWHDPWLPDEANPYIESPEIANFDLVKVEDLLSEHGKFWDMDLIQSIFTPRDRELVKKVSLSIRLLDDGWYWLGERKGSYSVKSGYHRLTRLNLSETSSQNSFLWSSIWNLFVPPKVKILVWRILSQCLPTCSALHHRHVPISTACPLCSGACEDDFHAMVSCRVAREVWNISPIGNLSAHFSNFVDFWLFLVKHKHKFLGLAASICLVLWSNRNDKVWNQHFSPAFILFSKAVDFLKSWQVAQLACRPISPSHPSPATIWSPPASGYIKLNVDGAIFSESGFAGFGLVLRGPDSVFLAARNGVLCCSLDPAIIEALSIREALSWIKENGWFNVSIGTDSLIFTQSMAQASEDLSPYFAIVRDCIGLLNELANCSITFVRRSANMVAHYLARSVSTLCNRGVWFDVPPSFLCSSLEADF